MYPVYEIIRTASFKWPDKVAIYDEFGSLTFKELQSEVEKTKNQFKELGLQEGVGLGVMGRNSRQFIISVFAGLGCGATILPISHQIKQEELKQIIEETGLHAIIDDKNGVAPPMSPNQEIEISGRSLRFSKTGISQDKRIAAHIKLAAFIRFSSGTTGKAKGVIVSHQGVMERIFAANKGLQLNEDDNVLWVLPMAFHFMVSIVLYLNVGATITICNDFMSQSIITFSNKFGSTLLYASPMHIRLLASDQSGSLFKSLKKVISTSTGIAPSISEAFNKRYAIPVSQAYGIIEIGLPILNHKKSITNPEAVGFALPDYQVEILDEQFTILPAGQEGQLAIKGPGFFAGYVNPLMLTDEVLVNGWFITGDLAVKDKEGLITISGRKKSMINVSGNKAFPEEVEAVIESHASVKASRVFGGKHPLMGEIVQAEVVLKENAAVETEELINFCRERLSTYKVPQRIFFVERIETTESGKKIRF